MDTPDDNPLSPLEPALPSGPGERLRWGHLYGASQGLATARAAARHRGPVVLVVPDSLTAQRVEEQIRFFMEARVDGCALSLLHFPDWETLPYDLFSPHQEIVSARLATMYRLPALRRGILVLPVATAMMRLPPRSHLESNSLVLREGDPLDLEAMRARLDLGGYRCVGQVMEHGEFSVRGGLVDLYPTGGDSPLRIDLLDEEVESIRTFDPSTQRSGTRVAEVEILPAREFPVSQEAIGRFRQSWRSRFEGNPTTCPVYRDVSHGLTPAGVEYYLPLFFERTQTLFDYLPRDSLVIYREDVPDAARTFWREAGERYEQRRHDVERPVLAPDELFLPADEVFARIERFPQVVMGHFEADGSIARHDFATRAPLVLSADARSAQPLSSLRDALHGFAGRTLLVAETGGRREALLELLRGQDLEPVQLESWTDFLASDAVLGITVAPLEEGAVIDAPPIAVVTEAQLYGDRAMQRRRRERARRDAESLIRDLAELSVGAPVVHELHGVGRYRGLERLDLGDVAGEFLALEYADGDKLYVPVSSLHLVTRYTGADPDSAPLHKLGSAQWQRARSRAANRVRDVAAELLEIHARRAARTGHAYTVDDPQYLAFVRGFPFEETPDQQGAIDAVLADMRTERPMDRLVCGDVGFGKTEVALRAAFVAVMDGHQVGVLVPTTLLAQQHLQTFADRFADWPVRVEQLSRLGNTGRHGEVLEALAAGKVDIVIGTHRLLQRDVKFRNLGLLIIDEEHRFGVRNKEQIKALRAEMDILTLTATPIPRTLNMALSGLRDLSLIATPPEDRLSIKTFVREWDGPLIQEACLREIRRGGQVYFVHNRVHDIEQIAERVRRLVPDAVVRVAHGQMRERDLERVMLDFYHQRFNVLVCTTIIESGIDVPSANTMIINRADRFGLAQLHQLRGRVGRSHHRAYAYLVVPPRQAMTADAVKRLEAIESLEELGIGFSLATHDLEIRGAGELLGDDQSGHIQEVGYSLYTRMLEHAVKALKAGRVPELDRPLDHGAEIDLHAPALIPDDYLPDVHMRLIMYKRIASAGELDQLEDLRVEMIDRFGSLPEALRTLFTITELKLRASALGIRKVDVGPRGGRILFEAQARVDPVRVVQLVQDEPGRYRMGGADRLRIVGELPDLAARLAAINELIERLDGSLGSTSKVQRPALSA